MSVKDDVAFRAEGSCGRLGLAVTTLRQFLRRQNAMPLVSAGNGNHTNASAGFCEFRDGTGHIHLRIVRMCADHHYPQIFSVHVRPFLLHLSAPPQIRITPLKKHARWPAATPLPTARHCIKIAIQFMRNHAVKIFSIAQAAEMWYLAFQ